MTFTRLNKRLQRTKSGTGAIDAPQSSIDKHNLSYRNPSTEEISERLERIKQDPGIDQHLKRT